MKRYCVTMRWRDGQYHYTSFDANSEKAARALAEAHAEQYHMTIEEMRPGQPIPKPCADSEDRTCLARYF